MRWKEYAEQYLFTDNYGKYLADLLPEQKFICGDNNSEKWISLFESIKKWQKEYLTSYEPVTIYSFWMWDINMTFGEFSLPLSSENSLEEVMPKIFLTEWALDFIDDEKTKNCYVWRDVYEEFQIKFNYPKEQCAWMSKAEFLEELRDIYKRSDKSFQLYKTERSNNPKLIAELETQYPRFQYYIQFFDENIPDLEIVRLNTFKPDEHMWYFVKAASTIYAIQISDFG